MVDTTDSIRMSPLGYGTVPAGRDGGTLYHFDSAHYRNEDINPIARLNTTQPAVMSSQERSERSMCAWPPNRWPHPRLVKGHTLSTGILASRHRPRILSNRLPRGRNVVEQRVKRSDSVSPSATQKDKLLSSTKSKPRQCKQAALDPCRSAIKMQLFNDLDLRSPAFSSHPDTATVLQESAKTAAVQQDFAEEAVNHRSLSEQSPTCKMESVHPLSGLSWPFDEALLSCEPTRGYRGGDGTQPSTTGSHGFPGFVTAGPTSSLFGYDFEGPVGQLFWA